MELKLRKETYYLADILLEHLLHRRKAILDNPAMVATVYLDPRYNRLLDMDKRNEAVKFLQLTKIKMVQLKRTNKVQPTKMNTMNSNMLFSQVKALMKICSPSFSQMTND